jgi:hypothetical protein
MSRMVLGVTLNFFDSARIWPRSHILTVVVPVRGLPAENIAITSVSVNVLDLIDFKSGPDLTDFPSSLHHRMPRVQILWQR